jgi:hypothetical protein
MGTGKKKKCRHCKRLFIPDARNRDRQKYCYRSECRKESKRASQRRWLKKPENRDHFSGPVNVERVREWRKSHPGYWKKNKIALQDSLDPQPSVYTDNLSQNPSIALQDLLNVQHAVLIGLIAKFTGFALQDEIASALLHLQQLGQDILNPLTNFKGGLYGVETSHLNKPHPQGALSVQLDRSQDCSRTAY